MGIVAIIVGTLLVIGVWRSHAAARWRRWLIGSIGAFVLLVGLLVTISTPSPHSVAIAPHQSHPVAAPVRPHQKAASAQPMATIGQWVTVGALAFRINSVTYEQQLPDAAYGAPSRVASPP